MTVACGLDFTVVACLSIDYYTTASEVYRQAHGPDSDDDDDDGRASLASEHPSVAQEGSSVLEGSSLLRPSQGKGSPGLAGMSESTWHGEESLISKAADEETGGSADDNDDDFTSATESDSEAASGSGSSGEDDDASSTDSEEDAKLRAKVVGVDGLDACDSLDRCHFMDERGGCRGPHACGCAVVRLCCC